MAEKNKNNNSLVFADNGYLSYIDFSKLSLADKLRRRLNIAKAQFDNGSLAKAGYALVGGYDPENPRLSAGDVPNPGMRDPKLIVSSVLTIDKFKNILKNYNPYAYCKPKLPEIKISDKIIDDTKNLKIDVNDLFTDNFIKYLEKQTGRKIKRIPYKNTKDGNIYKEGFSFVDENGKEIAHIAGNLKGKNVWVESSYVDPEFRHKGLGKLMYFDFNDNVYNTYGTTLHSSALQRVGYVDGGGISPSNRLWKSLTDNKLATTEGSGFDWWNIMADPSKIKPVYRKQGGKMNVLEFLKKGSGIHIKKKNRGKFTDYCGGKVTDECIRKAKASGNPTLVKRATFAANARKWKHENGGIIKAEDGTKVNTFQKIGNWLNSDTGKAISGTLLNGLSAGFLAKLMNDFINEYDDASKAKLKSLLNVSSKDYISKALSTMNPNENLSSLVLLKRAYDIGMLEALKSYNEEKENIDLLMFNLKQYASLLNLNNFFNAFSQLGNLLNYTNKKTTDNGAPSNDNT